MFPFLSLLCRQLFLPQHVDINRPLKLNHVSPTPQTWWSHCLPLQQKPTASWLRPKILAWSLTVLFHAHPTASLLAIPVGAAFRVRAESRSSSLRLSRPAWWPPPPICSPSFCLSTAARTCEIKSDSVSPLSNPSEASILSKTWVLITMDESPLADVTRYHKLRGANHTNALSCSSGGRQSPVGLMGRSQGVGRAMVLPEALREGLFLCPCWLLAAALIPWLMATSLQPLLPSSHLLLPLSHLSLPLVRTLVIHRNHRIIQDFLKILTWMTCVKSLARWGDIVPGSRDPGVDMLGAVILPATNGLQGPIPFGLAAWLPLWLSSSSLPLLSPGQTGPGTGWGMQANASKPWSVVFSHSPV